MYRISCRYMEQSFCRTIPSVLSLFTHSYSIGGLAFTHMIIYMAAISMQPKVINCTCIQLVTQSYPCAQTLVTPHPQISCCSAARSGDRCIFGMHSSQHIAFSVCRHVAICDTICRCTQSLVEFPGLPKRISNVIALSDVSFWLVAYPLQNPQQMSGWLTRTCSIQ